MRFRVTKAIDVLKQPKTLLWLVLVLALFLRLWHIDTRDIWYDELLTVLQSEKSIAVITEEVPTPIHYYFVHLFLFFGKSTLILGLPSVLFGLASIYILYRIGVMVKHEWLGLVSAFLLAISPMHIEFSQQILFFSYVVFFSVASLYFMVDFALAFERGEFRWKNLLWLAVVNGLNILTQMVVLVLIPLQALFLLYLFIKNPDIFLRFKKYFFMLGVFLLLFFGIISFIGGGGYASFLDKLRVDFDKPITVGYSLSHALGSTVLTFNEDFYRAMFSWFGIGDGYGLFVYLIFFLIGFATLLVSSASRSLALFFLLWVAGPFVFLSAVRLDHWFEEKYFIFIIPVYLLLVAQGIVWTVSKLSTWGQSRISLPETWSRPIGISLLLICIFGLAWEPIQSRTSFGFTFEEHVHYSWRKVHEYLVKNLKPGEKVFLIKGNKSFLEYYRDADTVPYEILDENDIALMSADQYDEFVRTQPTNYFVSIPDYYYLFLSALTEWKKIKMVGNFGIYQITFGKTGFIKPKVENNQWAYYEDFRTSQFIAQAKKWHNLFTSYADATPSPDIEGYNVLKPLRAEASFIDYKVTLPENTNGFYFQSLFSLEKGVRFQALLGEREEDLKPIYEQETDRFSYFQPVIKVPYVTKKSNTVFLRLRFDFDDRFEGVVERVRLKSFELSNHISEGVLFPKGYVVQKKDASTEYVYNATLEIEKSSKWTRAAVQKDGWLQTNDGFLIRNHGTKEENPLVFRFELDKKRYNGKLEFKGFGHHANPLDVFASTDGKNWITLGRADDNLFKVYSFEFPDIATGAWYLKFVSESVGPSSQIRNIQVSFTEE